MDTNGPDNDAHFAWERRFEAMLGVPATDGNQIDVLRNGMRIFPAMLEAIGAATETVDLVTFVYWQGHVAQLFADALSDAARRGCRVRVLLDAVGGRKLDEAIIDEMKEAGCDVRWFRPVTKRGVPQIGEIDHRTHRKILVCDGTVGFTGGVGIADEWDGDARNETEWRDTHLRIQGRAVAGLQAGFIENWADEYDDGFDPSAESVVEHTRPGTTSCTVVRGSAQTGASEMWRLLLTFITCAKERVRIASAYFNPEERLMEALCQAVERGVEVTILLPGEHADKRFVQIAGEASYARLLDAGVAINAYEISMMHAKVITVDGVVASVGSANFNQRSTHLDEEANVVIFDPAIVAELDRDFDDDLASSHPLDPSEWADRGPLQRAGEAVSNVVSDWL